MTALFAQYMVSPSRVLHWQPAKAHQSSMVLVIERVSELEPRAGGKNLFLPPLQRRSMNAQVGSQAIPMLLDLVDDRSPLAC